MTEFENVGWFSRLTGKQKTKDEIAQALRDHAQEWKREGTESRGLCAPPRSRSVSVAMAEKKDTRRQSLETFRGEAKAKDDSMKTRKEPERRPATEAEKAFAKAKEAEERASAAKLEATRLIAEANKALAAAAAAKAEASLPVPVSTHKSGDESSFSESQYSTIDLEESRTGLEERGLSSISTSSTFNMSLTLEDGKDMSDLNSRTFFSLSKRAYDEEGARTPVRISEKETKIRLEHANATEKAAKKAIKLATKLKHEAELAVAKAAEIESREREKTLKKLAKGIAAAKCSAVKSKEHDSSAPLENSDSLSLLRSNSTVGLDRSLSSNSLVGSPALTLQEVLASEIGVAAFKEFAAEGFVLENVSFVLEIRAFDLLEENSEPWLKRAHEIYDTYVKVGSPQEVNMTSKIRNDVVEKFEAGTLEPGIFKGLAAEVLRILRTNDWPRFVKSEQYKRLDAVSLAAAPSTTTS